MSKLVWLVPSYLQLVTSCGDKHHFQASVSLIFMFFAHYNTLNQCSSLGWRFACNAGKRRGWQSQPWRWNRWRLEHWWGKKNGESNSKVLREGFRRKKAEKIVFLTTPPRTPPPFALFSEKKNWPVIFFRKWTIDAWNKFYTWSHPKIFIFASVTSVYICP